MSNNLNNSNNNLDFESWDKKDLIEYIKKNIKTNNKNNNTNNNNNNNNNNNTENNHKGNKGKREFDFTKCCYRYIALKIAYFGWNYQGFAEQTQDKNVNTIEGHLFEVLKSLKLIQDRKTCHYSLCGRTDKGVSAFSQIVGLYVRSSLKNDPKKGIYSYEELKNLKKSKEVDIKNGDNSNENVNSNDNEIKNDCGKIENSMDIDNENLNYNILSEPIPEAVIQATENEMDYVSMLNRMLPIDIRVLAWSPIKSSFHARYNCSYRKYNYFFTKQDLDIELMQKACKKLEGLHDFRNFCKIDPTKHNKFERTIYSCSIFKASDISELYYKNNTDKKMIESSSSISLSSLNNDDNKKDISPYNPFDIYVFEIKSMAFLWHQVRCCMAILFLIGKHKENIDIIDKLFDVNDENDQGKPIYDLAPEIPLVLVDAGYPENTFYWINDNKSKPLSMKTDLNNDKNVKRKDENICINYIRNLTVLLETWQNEVIKLSLISKLLLDQWDFQELLNNTNNEIDNNPKTKSKNVFNQQFVNILKFIQSHNLDGWYNFKRIQKISIKDKISKSNTINYIPLLKRKKCTSFNEALKRKKQKKS